MNDISSWTKKKNHFFSPHLFSIGIVLILLVGVLMTSVLVQKRQDMQQSAAELGSGETYYVAPNGS